MSDDYLDFIRGKHMARERHGIDPLPLNQNLFDWQARTVKWALECGRAALFEDCGLGKTLQQLEWARNIAAVGGGKVMLHCPIGVRHQTLAESAKFGIDAKLVIRDSQGEIESGDQVVLANYDKLHKFDPSQFIGVVLDESSILKSYTGARKRQLIESWKHAKYKLCCSATPSPNDFMEIGNHAEFLGIMSSNEMLSRWFINDTMRAGGYRLKGHAESDYWRWIGSWAVTLACPSDIGGDNTGFDLPALRTEHHVVPDVYQVEPGMLFDMAGISATNVHRYKRRSAQSRCEKLSELVRDLEGRWVIWCDTNYEADILRKLIDDAVEVRGSDSESAKESKLRAFSQCEVQRIITKPTVAGYGMNWQNCHQVAFVGLSYSFEQQYQAIRRCWRFGQTEPVTQHVIMCESEEAMHRAQSRKRKMHRQLYEAAGKNNFVNDLRQLSTECPEISDYVPEYIDA